MSARNSDLGPQTWSRFCRIAVSAAASVIAISTTPAAESSIAELDYRLIAPEQAFAAGAHATIELVLLNRQGESILANLPSHMTGELECGSRRWRLAIAVDRDQLATEVPARGFGIARLVFDVPRDVTESGMLSLDQPARLRTPLAITRSEVATGSSAEVSPPAPASRSGETGSPTAIAHLKNHYAANFSVYEPIYFLYGPDAPAAKFQFSFRYQLAANDGWLARKTPYLRGLMFGYTQRTLWDVGDDSSPFYDTSYLPEIGYVFHAPEPKEDAFFTWLGWQAAFRHESNGRSGTDSRSLNTLFVRPAFALGDLDGWHLLVAPLFQAYVDQSGQNPDIDEYRGYGELRLVVGRNDGPSLAVMGRTGTDFDRGAVQLDLTIPTSLFSSNLATFLHAQYWNGYGESLRDYDQRSETVRFGVSLVR